MSSAGFRSDFTARDAQKYPSTVSGSGAVPAFVICVMGGRTVVDGFRISTGRRARGFIGSAGGYSKEGGTLVVSHNVAFDNRPAETIDDSTFASLIAGIDFTAARVRATSNGSREGPRGAAAEGEDEAHEPQADTEPARSRRARAAPTRVCGLR